MSNIFTGNEFKLSLNLDPNNRVPQGAGIHEIPYISSMPTLEVSSSVQSYETYGSGYEEYLLDNMSVSPMDITVSYVPDNEIHMQLEDLVSSRAEFQLILQYLIEDDRISYAIVNGKLSSKSTSGSKDSVVSKTYQFKPTNLIAQYSTIDALDALYVGNYGVGSNGNDVPQYETDAPTGNAFIKVPSNLQNNPTGTDLMGVGFIDGDSTAAIAMTKSGTLSLFARNQTTAWTRIYTATQMDGRYVPLTRTINGYPLSANVTLTKSDVGLGNVTNDAQLKIASNLSDLSDKAVARTNLDVYSKGEVDTKDATLNTKIDNVNSTLTDKIDTVNTKVDNTNTNISTNYVPKTTTINGKALSGNITLSKSDVGLGNVTNDAQLKIASNLSDLNNITTARTNIDVYSKGEVDNVVKKIVLPTIGSGVNYYKICTLRDPGSGAGYATLMISGSNGFGAAVKNLDYITLSARGITNLTSTNGDSYFTHTRLSGTSTNANMYISYVINADATVDIYIVSNGGYYNGCTVEITAIAGAGTAANSAIFGVLQSLNPSNSSWTTTAPSGAVQVSISNIYTQRDIIPLSNGGTGANNASTARTNLGLGTAAVLNTGTTPGQVMLTGSFGIGSNTASSINDITSNVDMMTRLKAIGGTVWRGATASGTTVTDGLYSHGSGIFLTAGDTMSAINIDYATGKVKVYAANNTALNAGTIQYNSLYGTANKPSLTADVTGTLPLANGGTGATTAAAARTSLGLGSSAVYNIGTSGANVPLLNAANTFSGNQGIQGNLSISNTGESRITLGTSVIRDNGNKSLVISSSSGTSGGVFIRPISDTDPSVQINGTNLGWTINGAVKLISSASFQSGLVIPFTNGDVTLRAINSTEGSGTGVVFDASNSTENSFGIVNTGGGSAVFHNYTKPSDSSAVATGVLIGGYGSRPWTGSTYTEHSNVSQHFLMDGTASATNHGGWFRLLTTPLNSTMDDRRQTFATSNNGDLYCGYDVPMGTYKLSANGLSDLNGRGIKQINNTANEVALITPANGAGSSSNIRATGFGGTFNAPTNTQTGHDMWIGLSGYNGSFTNTRGGLRTTAWANWTSTSTPVGLEVHTTPNNSTSRVAVWEFNPSGNLLPRNDNAYSLGIAGYRVSVVYAGSGTINTSDARLKTEVREFTGDEIAAAQALANEIGFYKWKESVGEKGEDAREHCGMTVQRAIEIMESYNLKPFEYGFICYDEWEESTVVNEYDENDNPIETIVPAGDRYSFRIEQLNLFISRGLKARMDSLEERLNALESK
ncbi:tail fiber domain-containing protein [Klebsiella variicola]|uniref:tail fiber domain-containing protein n=1 Tax=Klebsiella variicola TaxID=244366 RepID=UPI000B105410|nr:tail fiber domain-containing protein [Klebsiella variicola]